MTSVLLVLLSLAALGSSLAMFFASRGLPWAADALALVSALSGLGGFVLMVAFTIRRARWPGEARP